MVLAADYPFLGVLWSMLVFFVWIAWFLLLLFGRGATAYRIPISSLVVIMALGVFFVSRVPDVRPDRTVDEFARESLAGTTVDSSA